MAFRRLALGLAAIAASAAGALLASSADGPATADAAPRGATVTLSSTMFTPMRVTVRRGATVTWRWPGGGIRHDVAWVGRRPAADSRLRTSGTYRVRFTRRGTYRYLCSIHSSIGMVGTVVVR